MNNFKLSLILITVFSVGLLAQENAMPAEQTTLEEVTVEADMDNDYIEKSSNTVLKTNVPLLNTPQSASFLNRQFMDDTAVQDAEDAVGYVSGIKGGGYRNGFDLFYLRGYTAQFSAFKDGMQYDPGTKPHSLPSEELWGLERIEVIKGPAAALYGSAPIGGLIHFRSKRPMKVKKSTVDVRLEADHYGTFGQAADMHINFGIPNLYSRVVVLNRNSKSFTDGFEKSRIYVAPSITWDIIKDTKLTLHAMYHEDEGKYPVALPAYGTLKKNKQNKDLPISTYFGNKDVNNINPRIARYGYEFRSKIMDMISLRHDFRYSKMKTHWDKVFYVKPNTYGEGRGKSTDKMKMYAVDHLGEFDNFQTDSAVDLHFAFFGIENTFTTGFDFGYLKSHVNELSSSCGRGTKKNKKKKKPTDPSVPDPNWKKCFEVDPLNPKDADYSSIDFPKRGDYINKEYTEIGVYAQENMTIGPVVISLAGRYDMIKHEKEELDKKTKKVKSEKDKNEYAAFSPKAGISYEFLKGYAVYGNFGQSFKPNSTRLKGKDKKPLQPMTGMNFEGGFKMSILDNSIVSNVAFYHMELKNVATTPPGSEYAEGVGHHRISGAEFDLNVNPLPGLVSTMAYTFTNAKVVKQFGKKGVDYKDKFLPSVPSHMIALWVKYTMQSTFAKGLGAGLGTRWFGVNHFSDEANEYEMPSYALLDAVLYYAYGDNMKTQIGFYNILNQRYFKGARAEDFIVPGAPFNVRASVSATF